MSNLIRGADARPSTLATHFTDAFIVTNRSPFDLIIETQLCRIFRKMLAAQQKINGAPDFKTWSFVLDPRIGSASMEVKYQILKTVSIQHIHCYGANTLLF